MGQIVARPPESLHDTMAFKCLSTKSDPDGLYSKAVRFLDAAVPFLDSIATGPFGHYTLHNRGHAKKLLHLSQYIIDPSTLESMTSFEWLLLIYSAFLHDMTLAFSQEQLDLIIASSDFQSYLQDRRDMAAAITRKREELEHTRESARAGIEIDLAELHSVALAEFLRPSHATPEQYRRVIAHMRLSLSGEDPFSLRGVSFEDELIDICVSHNLPATVLSEMRSAHCERFPRRLVIADHTANTQFLAAILRLTDILDCDFERTPRILFDNLGIRDRRLPDADISLREWQRHLAVQQLQITEDEIVVIATSHHPAIESTVNAFGLDIEKEIRDTLAILKRNPAEISNQYHLRVPTTVRCDVRSLGYVYMDLKLKLDESAVTGLLMGTRLYPTRYAAVRELVQNGVDACAVRRHFETSVNYCPQVEIADFRDDDGYVWLVVRDNGIGMTEDVLRDHFFQVGSSYYQSAMFDRLLRVRNLDRIPLIARFGIGFLSVFMLGDEVEVETRRMALLGTDSVGWRLRIQQHGALAYVQVDNSIPEGTTVRVKLGVEDEDTEYVIDKILGYLQMNALRPQVKMRVRLRDGRLALRSADFAQLHQPLRVPKGEDIFKHLVAVRIDTQQHTDQFSGPIFVFLVRVPGSDKLDCRWHDMPLELSSDARVKGRVKLRPKWLFSIYAGNRVSVGGFRMVMKGLNRLLRLGNNTVPAIYDIDFKPGPHVDFDITRTKIRDHTMALRAELRRVVVEGLKAQEIFDLLTDRTKLSIVGRNYQPFWALDEERLRHNSRFVDDEQLLTKVEGLLPDGEWPIGVHRDIAGRLGIRPRQAYDSISTLLITKRVKRPSAFEGRRS